MCFSLGTNLLRDPSCKGTILNLNLEGGAQPRFQGPGNEVGGS